MQKIKGQIKRFYFSFATFGNLFRLHEINFLRQNLTLSPNSIILDVACGIGIFPIHLSSKVSCVIGFDISVNNISIANRVKHSNCFFYVANAEQIPHPDNSFDVVISICALEHFSNHKIALLEMNRVLKQTGKLLLTVDSMSSIKDMKFIAQHKKLCYVNTYFTQDSLSKELELAGFKLEYITNLMSGYLNTILTKFALRLFNFPYLFYLFSLLLYPISQLSHILAIKKDSGIIVGAVAIKKDSIE